MTDAATPSLVLECSPWTFADEKTGEVRKGYTLYYLDFDSPLVGKRKGFESMKISGPAPVVDEALKAIPGYYDLSFRVRANRETGKAELSLAGMSFVAPLQVPGMGNGR